MDIISDPVDPETNIGKKCTKRHMEGKQPKPFKSTFLVNTIKGVIDHPILHIPAYTFVEDDSYVECRNVVKMSDDKLLETMMDWTRIYRNEGKLNEEERKNYRALCAEIRKRGLLDPKNLYRPKD